MSDGNTTASRYRTKVDLALEGIQQAILSGVIQPGARLTMAQLSEELGMSATPIREAIRLLEADGIITNEPHRGATVVDLTADDAEELYHIRAAVESLATRLAVPRLTDADLEHLAELHAQMKSALDARDEDLLTRANASWHLHLYSASGTNYLLKLILRLWMQSRWGRLWVPERAAQSVSEHEAIYEALLRRDGDAAAQLMFEHIDHARELVVAHLRSDESRSADEGASVATISV